MDEATQEIDNYVGTIKENYSVGGNYMTFGDLIDKIVDEAVTEKDEVIAEKDEVIAEKNEAIAEKDETIAEKNAEIEELKAQLAKLQNK